MTSSNDAKGSGGHSHGGGVHLDAPALAILERGLRELLRMTESMDFRPLPTEEYQFPLTQMVYKEVPPASTARADVESRISTDPVSVLDSALVLLELCESNQGDLGDYLNDGMEFIRTVFRLKRSNGWIAIVGDADRGELERAIDARWKFRFFNGPDRPTGLYVLLNMLARHAYVYGRIPFGDPHAMGHFVEEHAPGVIICSEAMSDLELTLALGAMKMGVPAVVGADFPFPLGRTIRCDRPDEIADAVVRFENTHRLLRTPDVPRLPDYCDPDNQEEEVSHDVTWGGTDESFYVVEKGDGGAPAASDGVTVSGDPQGPIGVRITIDAEPMDAFDRQYIEGRIVGFLSMMHGVAAEYDGEKFAVHQAAGTDLDPRRIGEVLLAGIRREFPRVGNVSVEVIFDPAVLGELAPEVRRTKDARRAEIDATTEESIDKFYACVACSPFAPDHICALTPERPPQCSQPFGRIKTGALYAYDDMTNIHHSDMHRDVNSFIVVDKGRCLDPDRGEWEGLNAAAAKFTHGRTTRVQLHALDEAPQTSCSCFRLVMFQTDSPREGIGIMEAGYEHRAPDGRSWKDLHYALAGKQTPGLAGSAPNYLKSPKFLRAHGGWDSVVWVSPKLAAFMGDDLPPHVTVGE